MRGGPDAHMVNLRKHGKWKAQCSKRGRPRVKLKQASNTRVKLDLMSSCHGESRVSLNVYRARPANIISV